MEEKSNERLLDALAGGDLRDDDIFVLDNRERERERERGERERRGREGGRERESKGEKYANITVIHLYQSPAF